MHLYRPTYTRDIPPAAERVTVKGEPLLRWKARNGTPVTARPHPTKPDRCVVTVDCWWCEYTDHTGRRQREECYPDRAASERKMVEIRDRVRRIASGDISAATVARGNRSLAELLAEWGESMRAADTSEQQVTSQLYRVGRIIGSLKADRIVDLTSHEVSRTLKTLRTESRRFSPQTSNHYLTSCKSFTGWCVRRGFVEIDPLRDAEPVECESRRTFTRRALTPEELTALLAATRTNVVHQCPMTGLDRAALYLTAAYTGFRVAELGALVRSSFSLRGDQPTISLPGKATKNKQPAIQPIPTDVAAELRAWLASVPADQPIWPGYAWRTGKVVRVLRLDLAAAKIEPKTDAGVMDFHAFRTFYITQLARSGVPIQHAQRLARHASPETTTKHYTRLGISDLAEQIAKLPALKKPPAGDHSG
jgi:integrase